MRSVALPKMSPGQQDSWRGIVEVAQRLPHGWCIVGGQMVHLHCWERGATPSRPTDDGDAVLDVRAEPQMLLRFTSALRDLDFEPAGESWEGHQHRWIRGDAQIDVLIPRHLGERASLRKGIAGGTTLATPGAQAALNRAESVSVRVASVEGTVRRPSLMGAVAAKAAAYTVRLDRHRLRHLIDLAVLSTLVLPMDRDSATLTAVERRRIKAALDDLESDRGLVASVPGAGDGLARLRVATGT